MKQWLSILVSPKIDFAVRFTVAKVFLQHPPLPADGDHVQHKNHTQHYNNKERSNDSTCPEYLRLSVRLFETFKNKEINNTLMCSI